MLNPSKALGFAAACLGGAFALLSAPAHAWEPTRTVEIIVPAGTGGGADQMARTIQGIVTKHNLMKQSMVVINKAGGPAVTTSRRQGIEGKSTQANHHAVEPVHHPARDRHPF